MAEKPKRTRGSGSITTRRGVFWVKYHDRGRPYRESTGKRGRVGEAAARRLLKRRLGEIEAGKFRPGAEKVRVADLRTLVLADYANEDRRSAARVGQCYDHLEDFFGHTPAIDTPRRADAYVETRRKEGAAASTIRNEMNALRRGFTLALRRGILADRPMLPSVRVTTVRSGFIDDATMANILAALPDYISPLAEFCYRTAWRRGEASGLLWSDVDEKEGEIRIPGSRTKSGEPATFPFSSDGRLTELLGERRAATDAWQRERAEVVPLVFWRPTRRGAVPVRDCRKSWDTARKAAGVPGLLLHDLRRSRARLWSQRGVPDKVSMELGHWKTRSVFDRYRIVSDEDKRDALRRAADGETSRPTTRPKREAKAER